LLLQTFQLSKLLLDGLMLRGDDRFVLSDRFITLGNRDAMNNLAFGKGSIAFGNRNGLPGNRRLELLNIIRQIKVILTHNGKRLFNAELFQQTRR